MIKRLEGLTEFKTGNHVMIKRLEGLTEFKSRVVVSRVMSVSQ
jgi:hypothetical protein